MLCRLEHPNLARCLSVETLRPVTPVLVYERVDGRPLRTLAAAGLSIERACAIAADLASGLAAAHRAGIAHHILEPSKVLVGATTKLLDVGIAQFLPPRSPDRAKPTTIMRVDVDAPAFKSPEEIVQRIRPTAASNVYALGCLLVFALTGAPPFEDPSPYELEKHQVSTTPKPPSRRRPGISPRLDRLVLRMLAKDPAKRPTMAEVTAALRDPSILLPGPPRWLVPAAVAATVVVGLGVFVAVAWPGSDPPPPPPSFGVTDLVGTWQNDSRVHPQHLLIRTTYCSDGRMWSRSDNDDPAGVAITPAHAECAGRYELADGSASGKCDGRPWRWTFERTGERWDARDGAMTFIRTQPGECPDRPGQSLALGGAVAPRTLSWTALQAMATSHVITEDPQATDPTRKVDYRGVLVRDLLDGAGASSTTEDITFVCSDGYRVRIEAADARANNILLAVEADGIPIAPSKGGPMYLVHPWSDAGAAYRAKYTADAWAFYVTDMVVGTAPVTLRVGTKTFDRASLAALPATTVETYARWKGTGWPSTPVHLRGVAVTELLKAAGVTPIDRGRIVVTGRAPIHRDPVTPSGVTTQEIANCAPVVAYAAGPDETPIPAALGGPLVLAMRCEVPDVDHHWVTMVESIDVSP